MTTILRKRISAGLPLYPSFIPVRANERVKRHCGRLCIRQVEATLVNPLYYHTGDSLYLDRGFRECHVPALDPYLY